LEQRDLSFNVTSPVGSTGSAVIRSCLALWFSSRTVWRSPAINIDDRAAAVSVRQAW
jgi:hypothetical protein